MTTFNKNQRKHHAKNQVAVDRPKYREGNRDRAVKVFTINNESAYLLIQGVPDINITRELLELCSLYGAIDEYRILKDYPAEEFTKVYWIKYQQLQAARIAKRKLDDHSFYGGVLHVCYAPEYETISDTRLKLQERRKAVARRLRKLQQDDVHSSAGYKPENQTDSVTTHRTSDDTGDSTENQYEAPIGSKSDIDHEPSASVDEYGWPTLPEPPKQLPFEKWKHQKTSSDDNNIPRIPSAHSTLPPSFNPYPDGYRHPCPPTTQLQGPWYPKQNQSLLPQLKGPTNLKQSQEFDDLLPRVPNLHSVPHDVNPYSVSQAEKTQDSWQNHWLKPGNNAHVPIQDNVKKQDIKFVPSSVTRKRSSTQANLPNETNEPNKRVNRDIAQPKSGITFYRQDKLHMYGQPLVSNKTDDSCSFTKTIETIRGKMKMVSEVPISKPQAAKAPTRPTSSSSSSSSSERIRI